MKTVLITGGSGFIGKNLRESLAGKYHILAPSHNELDILNYVSLAAFVENHRADAIVHAAIHVPAINGANHEFFNDMQMFANIEKVSHNVEKVLYFGSGAEFDKRDDIRMVREEELGKTIPVSQYGLAKYLMTMLARSSKNIYNLRLFGIFGQYELWQIKFLSNLCCKAIFGLPLTVRKDCFFDFLYVKDLPEIVQWFLEHTPMYHDYNVCMGKPYRLRSLADMIVKISGKSLPIQMLSEERNFDYSASNARLAAEIPSLRITPMQEALTNLYTWYMKNKEQIDFMQLEKSR